MRLRPSATMLDGTFASGSAVRCAVTTMSLAAPWSPMSGAAAEDGTPAAVSSRTTTQVPVPAARATSPDPASIRSSACVTVMRPRTGWARRPCATVSDTRICTRACRASVATASAADCAGMSTVATCAVAGVLVVRIAAVAAPRNQWMCMLPPCRGAIAPFAGKDDRRRGFLIAR